MMRPIDAFSPSSKMASRPRAQSAARAVSSIADQVIRRITGMAPTLPVSERRPPMEPGVGLLQLRRQLQQHVVLAGASHEVRADG